MDSRSKKILNRFFERVTWAFVALAKTDQNIFQRVILFLDRMAFVWKISEGMTAQDFHTKSNN